MIAQRPRVVFWDTLPSPYGVEQYNLLADRGQLDFSVWFSRRTEPDRSWDVNESTWKFRGTHVEDPSCGLDAASRFERRCQRDRPDLLISPYGERAFVAGHAIAKSLGIRTILLVQPTFDAWVTRRWWKEGAKLLLFHSADGAQVPGPEGTLYARRYGFPANRIFPVRLTTNIQFFGRGLSDDERRDLRARLGVEGCVFLYAGRIWKPKGLLVLIEAFRRARALNNGMTLLVVGDGVDEHEIRAAAAGIEGVTFLPFVHVLPPYYSAADVFVFPTLGDPHGQVIEEAHAAGLPIITSDAVGDVHDRVVNGVTGFVVPAGDTSALTQRMLELAGDADLRAAMGARGVERVTTWGHEVYASQTEDMVRTCLALPRRTTLASRGMGAAGAALIQTARLVAMSLQREFV
jgi:glycosyltransferase involved in cell wall biosynthesis